MESVEIRAEQPSDGGAARAVVEAAFGDEGPVVADLVVALREAGHGLISLVAEVDAEIVGHVQLNRSWIDARQRLIEVLVLSPLAVRPDCQGRGIGAALVSAALLAAGEAGVPAVFLEGDPGYYRRHGFQTGAEHGFLSPSVRIPGPAFQVAVLGTHESWMTGALVYCDPFWSRDCVGLRDPLLRQLEEQYAPAAGPASGALSQ